MARGVLLLPCTRAFKLGTCLAVAITLAFISNQLLEASLRAPPAECALRPPRVEGREPGLDPNRIARAFGTPLRPRQPIAPTRPLPLKLLGTLDDHAAAVIDASTGWSSTGAASGSRGS